jgi:hypothetical protein
MARTCEYTFGDNTLRGIPAFKAYLVEGGLEKLFPGRSFPLNPVAKATRVAQEAIQPSLDIFANRAEAQADLVDRFGEGVNRFVDNGTINLLHGYEQWPSGVKPMLRGDEEAVFYNGKAYFNLDVIPKKRLPEVFVHELGEHAMLSRILGTKDYLNLLNQISILAKRPGSEANRIWQEVKNNYKHLAEGSKLFVSEVIAKLGEATPDAPWYKRLVARIKAYMMIHGLARGFVTGTIREHEIHALLVGSLKGALTGRRMNTPSFFGDTVQASFGGEKAKTAKLDSRTLAEQRLAAGEDAEVVRKETGWHRGVDMEMRFEIDDSKALPAEIGNTFNDVFEKAYLNNLGEKVTVGDVLIHPELFSAYPELAKIEVQELPEGTENAGRVIHKKGQPPVIQLSGTLSKNRWLLTLLHELQHGIQNIEGFAKGGESAKYADKNEYRRLYGEMEARNVMLRKGLTAEQRKETAPSKTQDIADEEAVVQFSRPPATAKQWDEWFGGSKMVKADGNPIVFFRGDKSDINLLDKAKLGVNTGHPATGLGFFFTQDKEEALGYGPNIKEVFLSIKNPFVMNWNDRLKYFHNPAEAKRFADKLKAEGYDGISIKDIGQAVIFESSQAKLTSNEKPKASTGDMRFSRPSEPVADSDTRVVSVGLEKNSAGEVRINRIVASQKNPADKARMRGFYDYMTGKENSAKEFGKISEVSYLQGWQKGENLRTAILKGKPWTEKTIEKEGAKWKWAVYREGAYFADGSVSSQAKAEELAGDAAIDAKDIRFSRPANYFHGDTDQNKELFGQGIKVIKNPTRAKAYRIAGESQYEEIRGVVDHSTGNLYISDAGKTLHEHIIEVAKLPEDRESRSMYELVKIPKDAIYDYRGNIFSDDTGMAQFSRPATEESPEWKSWSDNVRVKLQNTTDKLFGERLALLSVRQIVEVAKDYLPGIGAYENHMQERRAVIDTELRNAEQTVSLWRKLPKPIMRRLNRLVQSSTLSDVDASRSWAGVEWTPYGYSAYTQAKLNANNQERLKLAAEEAGAEAITKSSATFKSQEDAARFMDLIHKLESEQGAYRANNGYADENVDRRAKHIDLYKEHGALPENAKKVYSDANKLHMNLFNQRLDTLIARVSEAVLDANKRKEMIAALRLQFESNSLSWYYAPLARHGNHWFFGTDKDGKKWFRTFESQVGRDQAKSEFEAAGGAISGVGTSIKDMVNMRMDGGSDAFVLKVKDLIDKSLPADMAADLQDEVYQMYLATLPDVSVRHSAMHRKGTLGFVEDAMRSFSGAIHHGASQLANMKYGRKMEQVLRDHKKAIDMATSKYQMEKANREIEAAKMLTDNLDTLLAPGALEDQLAEVGDDANREQLLQEAIALRDKFKNEDPDVTEDSLDNFIKKQKDLIALAKDITPENSRKASDVVSELLQSYNAMVNTNSTAMDQVAGYVRQFGFMWMLGFGLSSGMVNMLQTPIVAMPVIAGKFGLAKTMSGFNKAYALMVKAIANKNSDEDGNKSISVELQKMLANSSISQALRDRLNDSVEAMTIFKEEGDISRTQTFDVIGVGREGEEYGGKLQDFSKKAGWMFHHGERVNREVTLYASYNLARDNGMDHEAAIEYARYANNRAHGDYSSENAARIFRGWPAGVALQFKKYPQMMLYLWGKTMVDWLNGWKKMPDGPAKEAAKLKSQEAGRTFAGLLTMQVAVAGAFGLPLMGAMQVLMDAIGGAVSDPDEPWDTEREVRTWLTEVGGETFATAMVKGALNAATPANFSDRLDLANLFFREPMKELEGRDAATNYIAQVAGPFGGLIQKLAEGGKLMTEGELLRGVEMASPKAIGDILKAGRFMTEDARSMNNAKLKDMSLMEDLLQLAGMSSSKLEVAYAERGFVKAAEAARNDTHRKLVNTAARAIQEGKPYPEEDIKAWNDKYPEWRITRDTVQKSLNAIKQNEKRRGIRGYSVNPKMEDLYTKYNLREENEE